MDPDSVDIQSHSILTEYQKQCKYLEKYCLTDFSSLLGIVYTMHVPVQDLHNGSVDDDDPFDPEYMEIQDTNNEILLLCRCKECQELQVMSVSI